MSFHEEILYLFEEFPRILYATVPSFFTLTTLVSHEETRITFPSISFKSSAGKQDDEAMI